jgi:hypothetical protein
MNWIQQFFVFCSGASLQLLRQCPEFERLRYVSIGITIVFTAILAFISSYYAISLIFDDKTLTIGLALFWALIIFNLDRYIVQSMRNDGDFKRKFILSVPRIIIAVFIAIVISKPLEIKLFENEINFFLEEKKRSALLALENEFITPKNQLKEEITVLQKSLEKKLNLRNKYFDDYMCECNGTCGTGIIGWGPNCEARKERFENYSIEYEKELIKGEQKILVLENQINELELAFENDKRQLAGQMKFGFFDRVKALSELDNWGAYFIMLIFILIETAPILTKLISSKGPYDHLLLEREFEFETHFLRRKDINLYQRQKSQQLNDISMRFGPNTNEYKLKDKLRAKTLERYEQIRLQQTEKNDK